MSGSAGSRHHPAITAGRPDDELRLAFVPVLLGGRGLLDNLGDEPIGYECGDMLCSAAATNVRFVRKSASATDAPSVGGGPLPESASIGIRIAGTIAAGAIGACRVSTACRPR